MKHTLIVIGWTGVQRAYLDVPREEAIARYTKSECETPEDGQIEQFEFDDEFGVYSAWAA